MSLSRGIAHYNHVYAHKALADRSPREFIATHKMRSSGPSLGAHPQHRGTDYEQTVRTLHVEKPSD
jgi:hypothetical protein